MTLQSTEHVQIINVVFSTVYVAHVNDQLVNNTLTLTFVVSVCGRREGGRAQARLLGTLCMQGKLNILSVLLLSIFL